MVVRLSMFPPFIEVWRLKANFWECNLFLSINHSLTKFVRPASSAKDEHTSPPPFFEASKEVAAPKAHRGHQLSAAMLVSVRVMFKCIFFHMQ